jgi:hypothetical protein
MLKNLVLMASVAVSFGGSILAFTTSASAAYYSFQVVTKSSPFSKTILFERGALDQPFRAKIGEKVSAKVVQDPST